MCYCSLIKIAFSQDLLIYKISASHAVSGASVAPTSEVCIAAMFVLVMIGNYEVNN
jgi:hypothetical protein